MKGLKFKESTADGCDATSYNGTQISPQEPTNQKDKLSQELKEALETLRAAEMNYGIQ